MKFDLVVKAGHVATAGDDFIGDIGIKDGVITAIGTRLGDAVEEIDAHGMLVTPGGVDAHCHIDEPPYLNARLADDFKSASRSAACGGTTTIVPFINQLSGCGLVEARDDYLARARWSLIDYAFHLILKSSDREMVKRELPLLLQSGLRSVKVFMTYSGYMMDDEAILDVMTSVRAVDGIVMVHAENGHCTHWKTSRLAASGTTGLSHFVEASPPAIEREATHRAITLGELAGTRVLIVHVSSGDALEQIQWAKARGYRVLAETCPQFLLDLGERLGSDDWETAKFICSPPPRQAEDAAALWKALTRGDFDLVSSDHCPYRFEGDDGKRAFGRSDLREVPPGLPGLETRLPLMFEEGVVKGRMSLRRFVELTSTRPAALYGLYPKKGSILPGGDADLVLWERNRPRCIAHRDLHDACDYTPYEGRRISAWPAITLSRGERVWDRGRVSDDYGRGKFVAAGGWSR